MTRRQPLARAGFCSGAALCALCLLASPVVGQAPTNPPAAPPAAAPPPAEKPAAEKPAAEKPAAAPARPRGTVVVTITGEQILGPIEKVADGQVHLATSPPRVVPLGDIERIELAAGGALALVWIGQDNRDLVQGSSAPGPSGVQDLHLRVSGLPRSRKIQQIVAVCKYPGQTRAWRLDPGASPLWRIGLEYAPGATVADLFLEPTAADSLDQVYEVTITYDDKTTSQLSVKATTSASDKVKVAAGTASPPADPPPVSPTPPQPSPAPAARSGPGVVVLLDAQHRLRGQLLELSADLLVLGTPWGSELKINLLSVAGLSFSGTNHVAGQQQFVERLQQPGPEDTVVVVGRDQQATTVSGSLEGFAEGSLLLKYGDAVRKIEAGRLVGVVLAARPAVERSTAPYQVLHLSTGDVIFGMLQGAGAEAFQLQTAWAGQCELPREAVLRIEFRNGRLLHLTDLEPLAVEEVPYFGRKLGYRRDASLSGGPLQIKGQSYARGLAVHSRCVLRYAVDGQYEKFLALVGFDDEAQGRGSVVCRVLGDGRELFARPQLRGGDPPAEVEVSIAGVKELVLEVDFGEREDTGDRVIWAQPRLLRGGPQ